MFFSHNPKYLILLFVFPNLLSYNYNFNYNKLGKLLVDSTKDYKFNSF